MMVFAHSAPGRSARRLTLLLAVALAAGCGSGEPGSAAAEQGGVSGPAGGASPTPASGPASQSSVQLFEVMDRTNGMVQSVTPYPTSWQVRQNPDGTLEATGPGGLRIHPTQTSQFSWSPDPFAQQTIRQMGKALAPVPSLEQVLRQQVEPAAAAQGNRLMHAYPIPEVEGLFTRFGAAMPQTGSRREFRALGSDWTDDRGTSTFVAMVLSVIQQQQMVTWTLQTTSLEASSDAFDEAKAGYLYGVGNTRINPQWQQMMNGRLQGQIRANQEYSRQMMEQSRAAHLQRMAAIESYGNQARSVGQTYSDILDISHAGYLERDDLNSAGHSALVDSIGERALIGNHETGEHYQVDAGSKYYWVSTDATYFGTDNPLYDPRTDARLNGADWTKFVKER